MLNKKNFTTKKRKDYRAYPDLRNVSPNSFFENGQVFPGRYASYLHASAIKCDGNGIGVLLRRHYDVKYMESTSILPVRFTIHFRKYLECSSTSERARILAIKFYFFSYLIDLI